MGDSCGRVNGVCFSLKVYMMFRQHYDMVLYINIVKNMKIKYFVIFSIKIWGRPKSHP